MMRFVSARTKNFDDSSCAVNVADPSPCAAQSLFKMVYLRPSVEWMRSRRLEMSPIPLVE